jgi:para-aminobenzoate synthetase component 1
MKGTSLGSTTESLEKLTKSTKEADEHATIVDLMRNDLSRVAKKVRVENFRYAEILSSGQSAHFQTSSKIVGELNAAWQNNLGDIIFTLLPAGSVTGAPKIKTVEIIKRAEKYNRGFYTGVAGYFDGERLNTCVLIRFIEKTPHGYEFKAGGGITSQSLVTSEFEELLRKIYIPT